MSQVNVINVVVAQEKSPFLSPISFEVFFEVLQPLKHSNLSHNFKYFSDLTWKIIYIGQANDPARDQVLEEAEMEDLNGGQMKFLFEVGPSKFTDFTLGPAS